MTNNLKKLLEGYKRLNVSKREVGDIFENIIKHYLETDGLYKNRFSKVYKWTEFPLRQTGDTGIDLVAELKNEEGKYCAIQCKFYDKDTVISKDDVDSFLSASGKDIFKERIFISTTNKWGKNAEDAISNQTIPVSRIGLAELYNSSIDWGKFDYQKPSDSLLQKPKKQPRPHQQQAIQNTLEGFKNADRGKLIMACGTGKTFTSLKLAEKYLPKKSIMLFLVPSLSLLSQTLREWADQKDRGMDFYAVCSDTKVDKQQEDIEAKDLEIPATTDSVKLAESIKTALNKNDTDMVVIFSTYQSIQAVSNAQKQGLPEFDLIICDEAHRTTGLDKSTLGDKTSHFIKVHSNDNVSAKKRLYMSATPRVYTESVKKKAEDNNTDYYSMDDENTYGKEFYNLKFGTAVEKDLLTDYQVLVLAISENYINKTMQQSMADENKELQLEDKAKIVGCWNGLSKKIKEEVNTDVKLLGNKNPMKRAVAFAGTIGTSELVASSFESVISEYKESKKDSNEELSALECKVEHVDGSMNALERNKRINWLKQEPNENECRILTNARCLSEGVDVPSLDSVLFLKPRKSIVDVVQSVGRVMRKAEGKEIGYVIIPVTVPAGTNPEETLDKSKSYEQIWQVLNALRSHDERLEAEINKIDLNKEKPSKIATLGIGFGDENKDNTETKTEQMTLDLGDLEAWKKALYAKIVQKCGQRTYWQNWSKDVATIAQRHIAMIENIVANNKEAKDAFNSFLKGLQENINASIEKDEAIEMLAQHLITKPVFNALFDDYDFASYNPVSQSMQSVLDILTKTLEVETKELEKFYKSVESRASSIDNADGKQRIIIELYDKFFKHAFPKMAERLGIVYTPIEVVDFIINSANDILHKEFKHTLNDKNVHIIDPFTGTGTFIVRLLQSGLISKENLEYKYKNELHANEIVLLAYYIATINIETVYHHVAKQERGVYTQFKGVCLTDTFNMFEKTKEDEGLGFNEFKIKENSERIEKQKQTPLTVIIGNPPYSAGQNSENDNNQNIKYPKLDANIANTYVKHSDANLNNKSYDSYKRAIRYATDRLNTKGNGIVAFVTNGSFLEGNADDGLRRSLVNEYSSIYIFNLRGNFRKFNKKEGQNIFGNVAGTTIAITVLVKKQGHDGQGKIYYHDIGDYLNRQEKLNIIKDFKSFKNMKLVEIVPNKKADWLNQRNNEDYETYQVLGSKEKSFIGETIFNNYTLGVVTNRDAWVYNYNKQELVSNVNKTINFYNSEVERYIQSGKAKEHENLKKAEVVKEVNDFVNPDATKISWSNNLKDAFAKKEILEFKQQSIRESLYRPFSKQYLYYGKDLNSRTGQIPSFKPKASLPNLFIGITGKGARRPFTALITDLTPDLNNYESGSQWFALYSYEKVAESKHNDMFTTSDEIIIDGYKRQDNISDEALKRFKEAYKDETITKEDIFYYIYGLLNNTDYQKEFNAEITKEIPRIPFAKGFEEFVKVGKKLAELHINYESVEHLSSVKVNIIKGKENEENLYNVEKMRFAKRQQTEDEIAIGSGKKAKKVDDKSKIIYNNFISVENIPQDAYKYIVNGKSAIEWVIDRYKITENKDSKIVNNPNLYSSDERYILNLLQSVIALSIKSVELIDSLPKMEVIKSKT